MLTKPFAAIRPNAKIVSAAAALPTDSHYAEAILAQFDTAIEKGVFVSDASPCYYLYELTMDEFCHVGFVACCATDDFTNGTIKHFDCASSAAVDDMVALEETLGAQVTPAVLAYRNNPDINVVVDAMRTTTPLYSFIAADGVTHRVWRMSEPTLIERFAEEFSNVDGAYLVSGFSTAEAAVRRGDAGCLAVFFPDEQLESVPYNRIVHDLNGLSEEEFLAAVEERFDILHSQRASLEPIDRGAIAMFFDGMWYGLGVKDPADALDTALLQDLLLGPVLGIEPGEESDRIEYFGGADVASELESRAGSGEGCGAAFALYPVNVGDLFALADAGELAPAKSLWLEPRLRSGLFVRRVD